MVTIPEFRTAAARRASRGAVVALAVAAGVVVFVVGLASLRQDTGLIAQLHTWLAAIFGWFGAVLAVWAVALAVIAFTVYRWRVAARNRLTRCPHCERSLASQVPLVIASHRCYHCGETVLIDPDEPPDADDDPPELPTRWEFTEADKRHQLIGVPVLLGGAVGSYLGCGGASAITGRMFGGAQVAVQVALSLIVPVATVSVLVFLYRRAKRSPAMTCYWCGTVLAGHRSMVAATRRCVKCGRTALAPRHRPYPPPHAGSPFTMPVLNERAAARRSANWRIFWQAVLMLVALGGVMALPYGLIGIDGLEQRLEPQVGPRWSIILATTGPFLLSAVGMIGVAVACGVSMTKAKRRHPLDCPRCGKEFLPSFTRATRCCNQCHWPIVADEPVT